MMNTNDNNIQDLINQMTKSPENYLHLQVFLHREHTILEPVFGRKFLFMSPNSFGLVKVNNLITEGNSIYMILEDAFTHQVAPFKIDVNDKSFKFLLIAWEDVLDIVHQEKDINC